MFMDVVLTALTALCNQISVPYLMRRNHIVSILTQLTAQH